MAQIIEKNTLYKIYLKYYPNEIMQKIASKMSISL